MPDNVNPYTPGQPVDDPDLFFGRRDLFTSIRENLVRGRRVVVVSGPPRIGKTSLLRQLPLHLPEDFVPVRMEPSDGDVQPLDRFLWHLAEAVAQQVEHHLGREVRDPEWIEFQGNADYLLESFWPQMRLLLGDVGLVLLLDDVDCLAQESDRLLDPLIALLSAWREQDEGLALVLTTSAMHQEALLREHPRLFGGAVTYMLGPLSSEEATRLITWPVDGVLTYDYGVARRLVEITSGQPYYLQLLCFELFNRCVPAGWVNQRDVDLVVEELVGRELADFRQVWDESSPPEQAVLAALVSLRGARGIATAQEVGTALTKAGARVEPGQVTEALDALVSRGILERLGALSYRFRVGLLRDWLGARIDLQEVAHDTRWDTPDQQGVSGDRRLPRLRVSKERRKAPSGPEPALVEAVGTEEEQEDTRRHRWLWIAAVIVAALVLLAALGWVFLPKPPLQPMPAAALTPTAHLATATQTPLPAKASPTLIPTQPAVVPAATDTPLPLPTSTATPTRPLVMARSVPSIAYQSRGVGEDTWVIHTMNSDGSNRISLGDGQAGFLSRPTWAPDGSRIAFVSDRDGASNIWVMNNDGTEPEKLTDQEAKDHSPAWSPDGEWIAFASVRDALYWELYVMRTDGSDVQRLTWWADASDLWPTWSPDGTRLAFASKRDGDWEIYTMDRDGSNLMRLTNDPADDTAPAWSPDGSRIAFESTRDGYAEIYVMPVGGGPAVNVSNTAWATDRGPTWSPDGGRIAFYSDRDGGWDIYAMASDGSNVVKLTGDNTNDQVPAWRP